MRIEDKIKAVICGEIGDLSVIDVADLSWRERRRASLMCPYSGSLFEEHSRVHSPWIIDGGRLSVAAVKEAALIGAFSYVNDGGYLRDRVLIGRFCSVGRRVTIGAGHHSTYRLSTSPALLELESLPDNEYSDFTVVGSDCWIGDGVVILRGVTIGSGAVIGANSVVTRDIPPYCVAVGAPARTFRLRFDQDIVSRLLELEWWNCPFSLIEKSLRQSPIIDDQISFLEDAKVGLDWLSILPFLAKKMLGPC